VIVKRVPQQQCPRHVQKGIGRKTGEEKRGMQGEKIHSIAQSGGTLKIKKEEEKSEHYRVSIGAWPNGKEKDGKLGSIRTCIVEGREKWKRKKSRQLKMKRKLKKTLGLGSRERSNHNRNETACEGRGKTKLAHRPCPGYSTTPSVEVQSSWCTFG